MTLTVKLLLEIIERYKIPLDTKIYYQRIEDQYFTGIDISGMGGCDYTPDGIYPSGSKGNGWTVLRIKGETYYYAVERNKKIEEGKLVKQGKLDKSEVAQVFWDEKYKNEQNPIDLSDEDLLDQYVGVFAAFYDKENKVLCMTAHY